MSHELENLTNLIDTFDKVEPWSSSSSSSVTDQEKSSSLPPVQKLESQDKSLGISFSVPVRLSSSATTNWMIISESNEYPTAQIRAAPTSAEPDRTVSVGIVIDDGFPVCCQSIEEALQKRQLEASQEAASAGGSLTISKQEIVNATEAFGEWEMTSGHPSFPSLLVREQVRIWNGMSVSISVVGPKSKMSTESFDLVYDVVTRTLNIDHNCLRLANNKTHHELERFLIVSHPMNCMLNMDLPRRMLLVDGSSSRPVQQHAAPALPGTVLTRCINPLTDVCFSVIALQTQDLGEDTQDSSSASSTTTIAHYTRQVRSHFHDGTSIAKIVDEHSGLMTFTAPAVDVPSGRLACAARPIPPRVGADPRLFLVLIASRVYDTRVDGAERLMEKVMMPQLVEFVSPQRILASTVPFEIVGTAAKPDEKTAHTLEISPDDLKRPPACRYFVVQHKDLVLLNKQKKQQLQQTENDIPSLSSFNSIKMGEACELQLPFFAAGDNNLSCILTRCVFGEVAATADGTGSNPVMRSVLMHKMQNKSIDSLFYETRYRSTQMDPSAKATTSRLGSYEVLNVTPSDENRHMSSIKQGFHVGRSVVGDSSSCVCSLVILMLNQQQQQQQHQMPPGMALSQ